MLISLFQRPFNGAHAFLWHCNTNCKLHTDEGRVCLPFLLSRAVCVRSFAVAAMLLQRAAKGALLPSFAVIICAWVRLHACTLFEAVYLPFARLLLLLQYFARLARFRAFIWLLLQPRLLQPLLCSPRSENQRAEGQRMEEGSERDKPTAAVGAFIVCGVRPRPAAISLQ